MAESGHVPNLRLTVAGGQRIDSGTNVPMLVSQALDLVGRGYTTWIKDPTAPGNVVQVSKTQDGAIAVLWLGGRREPAWTERVKATVASLTRGA